MGVTSRALGMPVESRSSVAGLTYGYRMMFCSSGVAPGASRPMLAVIRPHSSKLAEFISSWMPLGWKGICVLAVGPLRVLNPNLSVGCDPSAMRAYPSQLVLVLPGALHQPLATKFVP